MGSPTSLCEHGYDPYGCPKCEQEERAERKKGDWLAMSCIGGVGIGGVALAAGSIMGSKLTILVGGVIVIMALVIFGIGITPRR